MNYLSSVSLINLESLIPLGIWLFLAILAVFEIKLFWQFKKLNSQNKDQNWENIQKKYEIRGYGILRKAYRRAQMLLGQAELEGVKVAADNKVVLRHLEADYQKAFENTQDQLQESTSSQIKKAEEEFNSFLTDLKARSIKQDGLNQQFIQQRTNEIFNKLESSLGQFLQSTEQKSALAVQQELQAARQLIDTYKTQQLTFIDENILAILERTLSLVLIKKLTLKDQLDLVYEALEQAKIEKFII